MSNLIFKVLHLALCLITFIRTAREASKSEVENTQIHQHLVHEMLKGCCNLNWNSPKRSLKAVTFLVSGAGATASHHPFQEFVNARYQVRDQTWRLIPIFFTSTHSANQIQLNVPKCQCNTNHTTMVDIKAMRYLLLNCWYRTAHRRWTSVGFGEPFHFLLGFKNAGLNFCAGLKSDTTNWPIRWLGILAE